MEIALRNYKASDFNELIILLNKVYNSNINQKTLEEKYLTDDKNIIVALTCDNILVGCAFTEVQQDYVRPGRIIYVTYVAVNENYRKHGIGRKIFDYIEEMCHEKQCSAVEFTSANFRTEAHLFYEKLGFTKKQTTHFIKEIQLSVSCEK